MQIAWRSLMGLALVAVSLTAAPTLKDDPNAGQLTQGNAVIRDDMKSPCSVSVSDDGKNAYVASYQTNSLAVFTRDATTGDLTHVQTLDDAETLGGAVKVHVSPDGKYVTAASFRCRRISVYERDAKNGKLTLSDSANSVGSTNLAWPIDAVWSPDGKFIYVADSNAGRIGVFRFTDKGKLEGVEAFEGKEGCFANVRGLLCHPSGTTLFAASAMAGTVTVLDRDKVTGKLGIRQVLKNDEKQKGLAGVVALACSSDGEYIYTASGKFNGDHAVCTFKLLPTGTLTSVQTLLAKDKELPTFQGGNKIMMSPDGKSLYASGSNSGHLVVFRRDSKTGQLTHQQTIVPKKDTDALTGVNGLAITADGRHVYATVEGSHGVVPFVRRR